MNVIETKGLCRSFGATPAVLGLDLQVPEGSVFGLLGENGSGKTTTIRMIMGSLVPHDGEVRVWGHDPLRIPLRERARIGCVWDEMELPAWMRLREAMDLHASYFPQWDALQAQELLKRFELNLRAPFGTLSKGQKRRFLLLLAVAQHPDLLVLDEPSSGLDVAVRRQFLDLLMELANTRRLTILISSHILSDVERIIDRVAFIKAGRLVRQDSLEDLKAQVKRLHVATVDAEALLRQRFEVLSLQRNADGLLAVVNDFAPEKLAGLEARVEHLNLEELFLAFNTPRTAGEPA
jgi:ABC-2 type transport system ATP-binding protein